MTTRRSGAALRSVVKPARAAYNAGLDIVTKTQIVHSLMRVVPTELPGVLIVEPKIFADARGFFVETWQRERYAAFGMPSEWVQDNISSSTRGVLRGLHYQFPQPQAKLVYVIEGEILDVAMDIRRGSPTFGRSVAVTLNSREKRQVYLPAGFAHGFAVTSPTATIGYKCSTPYVAEHDRGVRWNDPDLQIAWPITEPVLSEKDSRLPRLCDIPAELLPPYVA